MPKATVQKYPDDETELHTVIRTLVEYFDDVAETSRRAANREQSVRELRARYTAPYRPRTYDLGGVLIRAGGVPGTLRRRA